MKPDRNCLLILNNLLQFHNINRTVCCYMFQWPLVGGNKNLCNVPFAGQHVSKGNDGWFHGPGRYCFHLDREMRIIGFCTFKKNLYRQNRAFRKVNLISNFQRKLHIILPFIPNCFHGQAERCFCLFGGPDVV